MASQIIGEKRRTNATMQKAEKGRINLTMTIVFWVVSDDKFASREDILVNTPNTPIVGVRYGANGLRCISKSIERSEEHPLWWEMTCEFDSSDAEHQTDPQDPENPDPTTWQTIIEWNTSLEDFRTWYFDYNGDLYQNTAKELFDPLPVRKRTLLATEFTQFEDSGLDVRVFAGRNNRINSSPFLQFPTHCLLLNVLGASLGMYNGFLCWSVKYRITHAPQFTHAGGTQGGWITPYYSFGWNYLDPADNKLKLYMTPGNNHIFGPLDANGNKTADPPNAADAHQFTRRDYDQIDFKTFIRVP